MLPSDPNERSTALHNKALTEYIVRVTDACIEIALKKKHPLQSALKHERAVMVTGRLTILRTMRRPDLHQWLVSRRIVVPGTRRLVDLQKHAIEYLTENKTKHAENRNNLQNLLNQ